MLTDAIKTHREKKLKQAEREACLWTERAAHEQARGEHWAASAMLKKACEAAQRADEIRNIIDATAAEAVR